MNEYCKWLLRDEVLFNYRQYCDLYAKQLLELNFDPEKISTYVDKLFTLGRWYRIAYSENLPKDMAEYEDFKSFPTINTVNSEHKI